MQAFEVHVQHVVLGVVNEAVVEVHQGIPGQAHRLVAEDAGIHLPQIGCDDRGKVHLGEHVAVQVDPGGDLGEQ